jgi:hypothetical protein
LKGFDGRQSSHSSASPTSTNTAQEAQGSQKKERKKKKKKSTFLAKNAMLTLFSLSTTRFDLYEMFLSFFFFLLNPSKQKSSAFGTTEHVQLPSVHFQQSSASFTQDERNKKMVEDLDLNHDSVGSANAVPVHISMPALPGYQIWSRRSRILISK